MGISNRCYGCEHYNGDAEAGWILCAINKGSMRGTTGCGSFTPDSLAGCLRCTHKSYRNKEYHTGFYCENGKSSTEVEGYCHGFSRANYWSDDEFNENKKKKSGGCFITTAVCSHKGLSDDCKELESLRSFRDTVLLTRKGWDCMVQEYYSIAPHILEHIDARADKAEIYDFLYDNYISPLSVPSVNDEEHLLRIATYRKMIKWLQYIC